MIYFDLREFEEDLKEWEGFSFEPYPDTEGIWTIGYGTTVLYGDKVTRKTRPILRQEARMHLVVDAWDAILGAREYAGGIWRFLTGVRQEVLANMCYQLGAAGLKGFVKSKMFLDSRDWEGFSKEILDSKWAYQTPRRAQEMSRRFRVSSKISR